MKHNYQADTDKLLSAIGESRPSLLLQSCCGPCSSYVLAYLVEFFDITLLFYNPNIQPREEYNKRLFWLERLAGGYNGDIKLLQCGYDGESFERVSAGFEEEPEGGTRCTECFRLRLGETARLAKERGFEYFCSTLTLSPHKDSERINKLGLAFEREYGVKWLPSDFKKRGGYGRSLELSKQLGLYRQSYCGCIFSLAETDIKREKHAENGE